MPKNKNDLKRGFGQDDTNDLATNFNEGYGIPTANLIGERDQALRSTKPVDIFKIRADLTQPRHILPSDVRVQWDGTADSIQYLLRLWINMVEQDRGGEPLLISDMLQAKEIEQVRTKSYLEKNLLDLIETAWTIITGGLINPITIFPNNVIETGERRWLAYHLLFLITEDAKWRTIPAKEVKKGDVWRQAAENTARSDLNAIGKARQYAKLMLALHEEVNGATFHDFTEFKHEHHYFYQAYELSAPYGHRGRILTAMGLQSPTELTRCRTILNLPDSVWMMADDYNIAQDVIIKCADMSEEEAITFLKSSQLGTIGKGGSAKKTFTEIAPKDVKKALDRVWNAALKGKRVTRKDIDQVVNWIDKLSEAGLIDP